MQEIFARRLEQFYASTSPLLAHYSAQATGPAATTRLVTLSGSTSDEIWPQLENVLRTHFPSVPERQDVKRRHSLSDAVLAQREQEARKKGEAAVRDEGRKSPPAQGKARTLTCHHWGESENFCLKVMVTLSTLRGGLIKSPKELMDHDGLERKISDRGSR